MKKKSQASTVEATIVPVVLPARYKVGLRRDLPIVEIKSWDATQAKERLIEWATDKDNFDAHKAKQAFLFYDVDHITNPESFLLPIADFKDHQLIVPSAALHHANESLPHLEIDEQIKQRGQTSIDDYFRRMNNALQLFGQFENDNKRGNNIMEYKSGVFVPVEIKGRTVTGYPAICGNIDLERDIIHFGAFAKTLQERAGRIRHLWMHRLSEPPTAVIDEIKEVSRDELPDQIIERAPDSTGGLQVMRTYLKHSLAESIFEGVKAGAIQEMSFSYDAVVFDFDETDQGELVRHLREVRLYETSDVNFGANDATLAAKNFFMPAPYIAEQVRYGLEALTNETLDPKDAKEIGAIIQMCIDHGGKSLDTTEGDPSPSPVTNDDEPEGELEDDDNAETQNADEDSPDGSITETPPESTIVEDSDKSSENESDEAGRAAELESLALTLRMAALDLELLEL
jgi:HK97 family phage prohead protease